MVEGIITESQFLQIGDLNLHILGRANVAHLQIHNVLGLIIDLADGCALALLHCLLVFPPCLLLLLHDTLDPYVAEMSSEVVDTGVGVDGEVVLQL